MTIFVITCHEWIWCVYSLIYFLLTGVSGRGCAALPGERGSGGSLQIKAKGGTGLHILIQSQKLDVQFFLNSIYIIYTHFITCFEVVVHVHVPVS